MSPGIATIGRHRGDVIYAEIPDDAQPGDYWRYVDAEGEPEVANGNAEKARLRGNLTGGVWGIYAPSGGIGTLVRHTVREHDDGTISVRPGDGSSNSILISGNGSWHGYIEHGVWNHI